MSVMIILESSTVSGGSASNQIQDNSYASASTAAAAVASGMLVLPSPVDPTSGATLKSRAVAVTAIREIVSL